MANNKPSWNPTRRDVLGCAGAVVAAGYLPARAQDFKSLHQRIIEAAHSRTGGKIRILIPNGSGANVAPVANRFLAETGVHVSISETGLDDINSRIALDWLSDQMDYDVALPATFGLPDLVTAGALRPIDEFAQRYEPPNFRESALYRTGDSFDGRLYGFQADGDAYVMFYNDNFLSNDRETKAYSDRFGSPLDVPLTWEELDRQMEWFHRPSEGMHGGILFRANGYVGWEWWVRFHAKGAWPLGDDLTPLIAGDLGLQALEDLIRASEFQAEGSSYFGLFDNWERYAKGDIHANIGWGGTQKYLNGPTSKVRDHLRFGPTPGGMVDQELLLTPYFNWGWTYSITANAVDPELAYLFTLFASTPEISTEAVGQRDGFFDPFRLEHYADPEIQKIYSPEFLEVHRASMRDAIPDLYIAGQAQYLGALNQWVQRAVDGQIRPAEALKRVSQQWELTSTNAGREKQAQRWADLRAKYPADARERLRFVS